MTTTGRLKVAAALLAGGLLLAAPAAGESLARPQVTRTPSLEATVLVELNAVREQHGLRPLRVSPRLAAAAASHSRAMAERGFFAHDSQDGTPFWRRIRRFYPAHGYAYWSVGENLLWSSPDVDAAGAVRMWLQSPPHRRNLLTPRWREVGLAAVHATAAPGSYEGREVTVLTADFGVRG